MRLLPFTYLKACRYPYEEDTDVDQCDNDSGSDHEKSPFISIGQYDAHLVDDDL
jgi:hypothetical protein